MKLKDRINSFVKLGKFLSQLDQDSTDFLLHKLEVLKIKIKEAEISNNWFTHESVLNSLRLFHVKCWRKILIFGLHLIICQKLRIKKEF